MPHVKGNKFKLKLSEKIAVRAEASNKTEDGNMGKKRRWQAAAARGATYMAVELAVPPPPTATAAAGGLPSSKKQRQRNKKEVSVPPAIPTVVPSVPKPGAAPALAAAAATSNWAVLKAAMQQQQEQFGMPRWRKMHAVDDGAAQAAMPATRPRSISSGTAPTKVVAVDCEMVGVGPGGQRSALARVCVVNSVGNVLLDRFVRPREKITDFRTKVSGIHPSNLRDAGAFDDVQRQVADLLKGRIIVGHALQNDLEVLLLSHRRKDVRDTAKYPPFMKPQARTGTLKPRALRHLAAEQLGLAIQDGEHSPVDDARAALYLYLAHRKEWERWQAGGKQQQLHQLRQQHLSSEALAMIDF